MTFVRTSELIGAKWEEFDLEAARWDIPAERMKMRTPHIVPLSKQALEMLALLKQLNGNVELLFPGERDPKKPMSNMLAHAPRNAVSAAYNHALHLEPRTRMMQDWSDFLEITQRGVKVVPSGRAGPNPV